MVETADARQSDDLRTLSRSLLGGPLDRTILVQAKVRPILMIVFNVRPDELAEVVFTEGDDMVQQLSPERACPRRLRTEGLDQPINARGELGVVVVDEVARDLIEREGGAAGLRSSLLA